MLSKKYITSAFLDAKRCFTISFITHSPLSRIRRWKRGCHSAPAVPPDNHNHTNIFIHGEPWRFQARFTKTTQNKSMEQTTTQKTGQYFMEQLVTVSVSTHIIIRNWFSVIFPVQWPALVERALAAVQNHPRWGCWAKYFVQTQIFAQAWI